MRLEAHAGNPLVSAELPETGKRFQGVLPPVSNVKRPSLAHRGPQQRAIEFLCVDTEHRRISAEENTMSIVNKLPWVDGVVLDAISFAVVARSCGKPFEEEAQ